MKLLRSTMCLATAVSVFVVSSHVNADWVMDAQEAGVSDEYDVVGRETHLRFLADGSGGVTPAPSPTTAAPKTTAPPPDPTTEAPVATSKPTTAPPETEAPTKAPPATTAPPIVNSGSGSSADAKKTRKPPTTQKPSVVSSAGSGSSGKKTPSNYIQPTVNDTTSASASSNNADTTKVGDDNKMSTGVVAGIVAGIVGGVALLACAIVSIVRKRRDDDDDPLSPFELSVDKGHNAPAILGSNVGGYGGGYNPKNNNSNAGYNDQATLYSSHSNAYAASAGAGAGSGAVAAAGGATVVAARARKNDTISSYSSNSSGAGRRPQATGASQQFYDSVTSPNSMNVRPQPNLYNSKLSSDDSDIDVNANESSNLWLSAMEPKPAVNNQRPNDVEGYPRETEVAMSFTPRGSYDDVPSYDVDIDQSSVMSGGSDMEKEFPDYAEGSSRGSYEL